MPIHQHTVPWLLVVICALTLAGTAAVAAFVAAPSYIMLGVALAAVFSGTGVVLAAMIHELGQGED